MFGRSKNIAWSLFETGCDTWTRWYVPEVKNIILIKTRSSETSAKLVEYKPEQISRNT